ncbi:hypothetical protein AB0392_11250 [Nonomuraea angiospora]|uniref:hypothetical protein n=1 Tax=Nonomuraea angiospora TaxID=46172 RepID=UPI00344B1BF7
MADISYLEAWRMWLDGQSTLGHELFGVPMIWLGRAGKVAAFISGLTILVDIAGADHLRAVADRLTAWREGITFVAAVTLGVWVLSWGMHSLPAYPIVDVDVPFVGDAINGVGYVIGLAIFIAVVGTMALQLGSGMAVAVQKLVTAAAVMLEHPRAVQIRLVALLLLLVGFHFDLLAS